MAYLPDCALWGGCLNRKESCHYTTGFTGSTGATGPPGDTGPTGQRGSPGTQGDRGFTGYTGGTGFSGFIGSPGDPGFTGSTGPTGARGLRGLAGLPGARGQGAVGRAGPPGPLGDTGSTGFTGKTVLSVSAAVADNGFVCHSFDCSRCLQLTKNGLQNVSYHRNVSRVRAIFAFKIVYSCICVSKKQTQKLFSIALQKNLVLILAISRAPSCPEIPDISEILKLSQNCPEIRNCSEILVIW